MPKKNSCNLAFLQDLAEGKKKYLLRRNVPQFSVPQWPELATKRLLPGVLADRDLKDYFPNYGNNKVPDRSFFWGVLAAIKPCFTQALVKQALD